MSEEIKLNRPWLVAVWPGMGHVAISAGYYLMAKLSMHVLAGFSPRELFDVEHVEIDHGIISPGRLPRSRCFVWNDPQGKRDIVVFIGEAQPPLGKYAFCHKQIEFAQQIGVERVFPFAAMATQMHPQRQPRVFCAATSEAGLVDLQNLKLETLNEGHIGGLNGILLGAAAEVGLNGACLLGELPHVWRRCRSRRLRWPCCGRFNLWPASRLISLN
jgi:proteasome assembly chaperone (PAC2) family protein